MAEGQRASKRRPTASVEKRVSLKNIAELTGYSITTVSMVLTGRADEFSIAARTQALILDAARKLDYQPNLHARSLRSRTTNLLGLMVPTLNNRFFSEMAETFERLARNDKKLALISVTNYDRHEEIEALKYYLSQDVRCVFNANPTGLRELSDLCRRSGTQQIVLDAPKSDRATISTDNFDAALALTRLLLKSISAAGRKGRIYFLGGMADHEVTKLRLAGFRTGLQEQGIRYSADLFLETLFDAESAYHRVKLLLRTQTDVAAVFVNSLLVMDGLVKFIGENPDACRAVHYGVFDYHPMMNLLVDLQIASIRQNPELMMQKAYEIFSEPDAHPPERMEYVPYELIVAPRMRRFVARNTAQQERTGEATK
jgi:DNA-binding LacI/PurR family transcriptional regulator